MVVEIIQRYLLQKEQARREAKLKALSWDKVLEYVGKKNEVSFLVSYKCASGGGGIIPVDRKNIEIHNPLIQQHIRHGDKMRLVFFNDVVVTHNKRILNVQPKVSQEFKLVP